MKPLRDMWSILCALCVASVFAVAVPQFSGCAQGTNSMGSTLLPTADTFNKRLAAADVLDTAVRRAAIALLNAGKITAEDGDNVLKATDAARAGLDIARKLSALDLTSADAKLNAVSITLTALSEYLTTRSK